MNDVLLPPAAGLADDEARTASEAVVETVADAADASPLDLEPLARTLDPDALDSFVARLSDGSGASVEFAYSGYDVLVSGDGSVEVSER